MNCIQPTAPAELGPMLRPKFDSILLIAASTCQGTPYCAPALCQSGRSAPQSPGTNAATESGAGGIAGAAAVLSWRAPEVPGLFAGAGGRRDGLAREGLAAVGVRSTDDNDTLTITDAGYPIPTTTQRIDLALEPGVPGFLQTLKVVLIELFVERIILAEEIQQYSPHILQGIQELLPGIPIQYVPHVEFKQIAPSSRAIIRTAEYTPYSNIILVAGPWGFKL